MAQNDGGAGGEPNVERDRVWLRRRVDLSGLVGWVLGRIGLHHLDSLGIAAPDRLRVTNALFPKGAGELRHYLFRYASLLTLSVLIGAMGLLADSPAVVIGAMLVAPLMMPILGMAAGLVLGWLSRVAQQALIAVVGAAGAVGLAALVSFVVPGDPYPLPPEVMSRTAPSLLDLGIALVAGAAAAYSKIRHQASDAITGAAVAVALVPPLASLGILLELGEVELATGALLLFAANAVGIVMSAAITFIVCGLVPGDQLLSFNRRIARCLRWAALAVVVVVVPLSYGRGPLQPDVDQTHIAAERTAELVEMLNPEAEMVDIDVAETDDGLVIEIVVTTPDGEPTADTIAAALAEDLGKQVDVRVQAIESTVNRARIGPAG